MPRAKSASPFLSSTPLGTQMHLGRPRSVEAVTTLAGGNSRHTSSGQSVPVGSMVGDVADAAVSGTRTFSTHSSFNKIVSISASPPPAASRKKMIARPG